MPIRLIAPVRFVGLDLRLSGAAGPNEPRFPRWTWNEYNPRVDLRHFGRKSSDMTMLRGIIQNGQVVMPEPVDLPDGTEVEILPVDFSAEVQEWGANDSRRDRPNSSCYGQSRTL